MAQELLPAQHLAVARTGPAVQRQLNDLARLHGRIQQGKPTLTGHCHMGAARVGLGSIPAGNIIPDR